MEVAKIDNDSAQKPKNSVNSHTAVCLDMAVGLSVVIKFLQNSRKA
jgi:hypothetical protein